MDDLLKVLIYIIMIAIYAFFKIKKKADSNPKPTARKESMPHTVPAKSFADVPPRKTGPSLKDTIKKLEKEIDKSQKTVKAEKHIKSGRVYGEKIAEKYERKGLERMSSSSELPAVNIQDHFDRIQNYSEIKNYESGYEDKSIIFEYPDEDKSKVNPYSDFLKDMENVKKAIVMKEIFDKKHF